MPCPQCGCELSVPAKFCRNCGAKIAEEPAAEKNPRSTRPRKTAPEKESAPAAPKEKKKSPGKRIIAAAMAAALLFTGLVNPGFLRPKKKPVTVEYPVSSHSSLNLDAPAAGGYHPGLKEIEKITPLTAEISNAAPTTEVGGLSFDFFSWNKQ